MQSKESIEEEAKMMGIAIGKYLQDFATLEERLNIVMGVIGDKDPWDVDPRYVVEKCIEMYQWPIEVVAAGHYLTILQHPSLRSHCK